MCTGLVGSTCAATLFTFSLTLTLSRSSKAAKTVTTTAAALLKSLMAGTAPQLWTAVIAPQQLSIAYKTQLLLDRLSLITAGELSVAPAPSISAHGKHTILGTSICKRVCDVLTNLLKTWQTKWRCFHTPLHIQTPHVKDNSRT